MVTNDAPETAKPTEAFNITIVDICGRSYDKNAEQEDHLDFTETQTLRDAFNVTDETVFPKMQESALHK